MKVQEKLKRKKGGMGNEQNREVDRGGKRTS